MIDTTHHAARAVTIPVGDEGFSLEGLLEGPADGAPVVVCHPHPAFGGTLDTPIVAALAAALAEAGSATLRFNFRGIGRSGGQATGGRVEERDVMAACAWLRARAGDASHREIALVGYSFGALMSAKALGVGEHARAFVALGLPTVLLDSDEEREQRIARGLAACPALALSGTRDQFSELPRLRAWAAAIPSLELEVLDGIDHFPAGDTLAAVCARIVRFVADQ